MVTVDSNVWVSALAFRKGKAHLLLQQAIEGRIRVAITDVILNETRRILRDKFHVPSEDLQEAADILTSCTHRVVPARVIEGACDDPDDNRILECAVASGSECIVTGDNDLLRMGQFESVQMVRLSDFLARRRER